MNNNLTTPFCRDGWEYAAIGVVAVRHRTKRKNSTYSCHDMLELFRFFSTDAMQPPPTVYSSCRIFGMRFDRKYLKAILSLPNVRIKRVGDKLAFVSGAYQGFLMANRAAKSKETPC